MLIGQERTKFGAEMAAFLTASSSGPAKTAFRVTTPVFVLAVLNVKNRVREQLHLCDICLTASVIAPKTPDAGGLPDDDKRR